MIITININMMRMLMIVFKLADQFTIIIIYKMIFTINNLKCVIILSKHVHQLNMMMKNFNIHNH